MRHHRRAQNANPDVELVRIPENRGAGNEAADHGRGVGFGDQDLEQEASANRGDEYHDERLEQPEPPLLQVQHREDIQRSDRDPPRQWKAEQQVQRDRRADDFRQVARRDRDLAYDPEEQGDGPRIVVATCLRQVPARHDAEFCSETLQQDRHQIREAG